MVDNAVLPLNRLFHFSMLASLTIVILAVLPVAAGLECKPGWKAFAPTHCCYKVVYKPRITFTNADKKCQEEDSRLASIHSKAENDEIFEQIKNLSRRYLDGIWIGYRTLQPKMHTYEWVDGSPNDYTNWAHGEPNNWASLAEDCVSMYPRNVHRSSIRKWNDRPCNTHLGNIDGYVCKECPRSDECPAGSIDFGEYCYLPVKTKLNFDDAEKYCVAKGGHLTSILDDGERKFVAGLIKTLAKGFFERVWIGLSWTGPGRQFSWSDGTKVEGESSITNSIRFSTIKTHSCIRMQQDGNLFPYRCKSSHSFICKKPKDEKHYHALVRELTKKIFANYSRNVIPSKNPNNTMKFWMWLRVTKLVEVNEKASTVAIQGNLQLIWMDDYLKWDPNGRYKGIYKLVIRPWRIWKPNMFVENGLPKPYPFRTSSLKLKFSGRVVQMYRSSINASCEMKVYRFPYDKQSCEIWIGQGVYRMSQLRLASASASLRYTIRKQSFIVNGWKLNSVTGNAYFVYFNTSTHKYTRYRKPREDAESKKWSVGSYLVVTLELERYNPYFITTMLIPALIATVLNLVSFMISSFELSVGILLFNLLLQVIFMVDAGSSIPQTIVMDDVPSLLFYYGFNFITTGITFMLFIFVHFATGFIQTWLAELSLINSVANSELLIRVIDVLPRDNLRLDLLSEDYEDAPPVDPKADDQRQSLLHKIKMIVFLILLIVHVIVAICLSV